MTALEGPEWTESRITQRLEVWEKLIKLADTREGIDAFQHKRKPQWNARLASIHRVNRGYVWAW